MTIDPTRRDEPVRIAWHTARDVEIVVAGVDIAPLVRRVVLEFDATDLHPLLTVTLDTAAVTAGLREAVVQSDDGTEAALRALGWTPPCTGFSRITPDTTPGGDR